MKITKITTYGRKDTVLEFLDTVGFTRNPLFDDPTGTPGYGYYRERTSMNMGQRYKLFKDKATFYSVGVYSTVLFEYDYEVSDL